MTWSARLGVSVVSVVAAAICAVPFALIIGTLGQMAGWNHELVGRIGAIAGVAVGVVAVPAVMHRVWPAARQVSRASLGAGAFLGVFGVAMARALLKASDPFEASGLGEMMLLQCIQVVAWACGVAMTFGVLSWMSRRTTMR
jgi:hypothetical protein